jgi:hypothetical protein
LIQIYIVQAGSVWLINSNVFGTHIVAVYTIILKNSPGVQYIYLCNKPFKKKPPKLYKLVVFAAPPLSRQYHGKVGSEYG